MITLRVIGCKIIVLAKAFENGVVAKDNLCLNVSLMVVVNGGRGSKIK